MVLEKYMRQSVAEAQQVFLLKMINSFYGVTVIDEKGFTGAGKSVKQLSFQRGFILNIIFFSIGLHWPLSSLPGDPIFYYHWACLPFGYKKMPLGVAAFFV